MRSRRAPRVTRDRTRATTSTIDFRVIYPTRTRARPAPARARASPRHSRTDASIIHHPATPASHPSIHPSIHDALARSSRTLLARTATDRRRCVVCLTLVVTTGVARARADRMIGPGRGVTNDEARLARSPRLGHSSGSIARRGLDARSRSVDRGGGRATGRPNVRTHTHGWRDRRDRGRDMGARGRTLRARAHAAMRVIYVEMVGRSDTVVGRTPVVDPCVSNA